MYTLDKNILVSILYKDKIKVVQFQTEWRLSAAGHLAQTAQYYTIYHDFHDFKYYLYEEILIHYNEEDKMNNKKISYIVLNIVNILGIIIILIFIPFVIEKIILEENHFPFNIYIGLSRDSWFGFMASYMGAIGTVILGIIALWQNKRYKELSDKSTEEVNRVQNELKELSKKTVDAIKTLERIELAIYNPVIQNVPYDFYGITKKSLDKWIGNEAIVYQQNLLNIRHDEMILPLDKLMDKYKTFGFAIRNLGEKTIRNFICTDILINGKEPEARINIDCDIPSGNFALILFVNLPLKESSEINLKFEFNNLIMEKYRFDTEIDIVINKEDFNAFIDLEAPKKYE